MVFTNNLWCKNTNTNLSETFNLYIFLRYLKYIHHALLIYKIASSHSQLTPDMFSANNINDIQMFRADNEFNSGIHPKYVVSNCHYYTHTI